MKSILAPIHSAGWPFIFIFLIVSFFLFPLSEALGYMGLLLTAWCIYFFRNPRRVTPLGKGLIISPADGVITKITRVSPPKELKWETKPLSRISIFLNVFDVHVNRIPIDGTISKVHYHPGKFFNASLDKASEHNERNSVIIKTPAGEEVLVVQIAGLVARRILCDIVEGEDVKAGQLYGIIRFGSRADVYLPEGVEPQVVEGQRMIGGETILADLFSNAPQRKGEVRA